MAIGVIPQLLYAPPLQADQGPRSNIILILADDLGYGEQGCQGNRQIPTPHIDSIAENGVRFTSGYVTAAYCSPSRAGLLTGRYQSRFGYEMNPVGARNEDPAVGLPTGEKTIADYLQEAGYVTGLMGKWHLGGTAAYHPLRRGFDDFYGFLHEGHFFVPPPYRNVTTMLRRRQIPSGGEGRQQIGDRIYSTHMGHSEPAYDANNPIFRGSQPVSEETYLTDAITREACQFIERNRKQPFFLYVPYNAVHSPLQATAEKMQEFAHIENIHRRIFAAMLSSLDDGVGKILAELEKQNLSKETLVIFLSDNGGPTRELTSSNGVLRGGKGDMYEGGIRVPFMLQWAGTIPAGGTFDAPVSSLDLLPTILGVAGKRISADRLDGVDLLPWLTDKRSGRPHQVLFWRQLSKSAMREGDWKIVRNGRSAGPGNKWELYDLKSDLKEKTDLATAEPDQLDAMLKTWQSFTSQLPE